MQSFYYYISITKYFLTKTDPYINAVLILLTVSGSISFCSQFSRLWAKHASEQWRKNTRNSNIIPPVCVYSEYWSLCSWETLCHKCQCTRIITLTTWEQMSWTSRLTRKGNIKVEPCCDCFSLVSIKRHIYTFLNRQFCRKQVWQTRPYCEYFSHRQPYSVTLSFTVLRN